MGKVTAETITMGQVLQHYWDARDPSIVRACITVLHGMPMIASYAEPTRAEKYAALEAVVADWNVRHAQEVDCG